VRLLLDTHIVLWELAERWRIRDEAAEAIRAADELRFSVVSFVEIGIKAATGKLTVPDRLREHIQEVGLQVLGLTPEHGLGIATLPLHHRDPFDRLLISQARHEGLTIVTEDSRFAAYDVPVIAAR
jgi:PIN domain nuclease of toxin-antitoxin system